MNRQLIGAYGESIAAAYYRKQGYSIEAANFTCRMGEIDIVAQKGETLVFAEVKTRGEGSIGEPREAVGHQKQQRLIQAAQSYLLRHNIGDVPMRFDVVEIYLAQNQKPRVRCIQNAFGL